MPTKITAQIITIGDEILIGQIIDTNSAWLAAELTKLGFTISQMRSIADNAHDISMSIENALKYDQLVIITGGLGPTKDDITKLTLCSLFNTELEFNETAYADVESFLQQRGAKMNALNKNQALFPKSALLLRNKQGTAPGIWFEQKKHIIISLPGVPWEMKGIFNQEIKQKLIQHFDLPEIYYQTAMITGLGESQLALLIEDWENNLPENISLAYLPSPGMIRLRLGINGNNRAVLMQILQNQIDKLHKIIPENIISDTEVTLQEITGKLLLINNKTLSIAESCTGGTIAQLITSIPGSSQYFKGSVVAYANDIKTALLDVPAELIERYGAVSKEVAESMAIGVKSRLNTHYSISTTGIAGPDGGTEDKPVGTVWIAISAPDGTFSKKFTFGKERDINIQRSAMAALNMLREIIFKYS